MINDINFSNSFIFRTFEFQKNCKNDNRSGIRVHYFAYMISGSAKLVADDKTVEIKEGDAFYIPCGKKYQSFWYGEPNIRFISLGFGYMPLFGVPGFNMQSHPCAKKAKELFFKIAEAEALNAEAVGDFYTLLAMLTEKMTPDERVGKSDLVRRAESAIVTNPTLSVREIARLLAVSESTLYAAFKKHSELGINGTKIKVIMEKARDLLISTDIPIEELSANLGFSSSSYFRKQFRSHFGKSPREMRKLYTI